MVIIKFILLWVFKAAPWRKRLDARIPSLGSRVCVSVTPCGFCGRHNGVWVGLSRCFPVFSCHKFHSIISPHSSHSFQFMSSCDGASGMVGRYPCKSQTFKGLHHISSLDPAYARHELRRRWNFRFIDSHTVSRISQTSFLLFYFIHLIYRNLTSLVISCLGSLGVYQVAVYFYCCVMYVSMLSIFI